MCRARVFPGFILKRLLRTFGFPVVDLLQKVGTTTYYSVMQMSLSLLRSWSAYVLESCDFHSWMTRPAPSHTVRNEKVNGDLSSAPFGPSFGPPILSPFYICPPDPLEVLDNYYVVACQERRKRAATWPANYITAFHWPIINCGVAVPPIYTCTVSQSLHLSINIIQ